MTVLPGRSACYRCLFPEPPDPDEVPTCQAAGVIGGIAGVIGALQAGEAIKYLTGRGELLDRPPADLRRAERPLAARPAGAQPALPGVRGAAPPPPVLDAAAGARYGS